MAPTSHNLTEGPIGRNLFAFALPILAGNVAQSLNGSVNAVWVGRFLGEEALTATANANNIMFFLIGSVFGIGMAATILIAQAMGARDLTQARRVMGTSATFFIGLSAAIAACGWWLSPHLLGAMGTPAASLPLAGDYLRVIFLAMPALYAFAFLSAALRGVGDSRTPFRFLLLAVLLDIAPEIAAARKQQHRDAFEQDLGLLGRVRASYLRQAKAAAGWHVVDAARDRDVITGDVTALITTL